LYYWSNEADYWQTWSIARPLCDSRATMSCTCVCFWSNCLIMLNSSRRKDIYVHEPSSKWIVLCFCRASAMHMRDLAMRGVSVCPSVWLSVRHTLVMSQNYKTNKRMIMRFSPWGSPGTLIFYRQHSDARYWYSNSIFLSVRLSVAFRYCMETA